jgi:hypothetical protein
LKHLVFLLFSIIAFAQSKPIELKIDSLKTINTKDGIREFTLQYHIANLTEKPITFVLNTTHLVPIGSGSLRPNPYYKIYENDNAIEVSSILTDQREIRYFKDEAAYKTYIDSLTLHVKSQTPEELAQLRKKNFLDNIQILKPKETQYFTTILVWDKNRYHRNGDIEYYIEEKEKHFLELHINLMAEELLLNFSEAEKIELLKDKILTKGWFTSNKIEIDLGE